MWTWRSCNGAVCEVVTIREKVLVMLPAQQWAHKVASAEYPRACITAGGWWPRRACIVAEEALKTVFNWINDRNKGELGVGVLIVPINNGTIVQSADASCKWQGETTYAGNLFDGDKNPSSLWNVAYWHHSLWSPMYYLKYRWHYLGRLEQNPGNDVSNLCHVHVRFFISSVNSCPGNVLFRRSLGGGSSTIINELVAVALLW